MNEFGGDYLQDCGPYLPLQSVRDELVRPDLLNIRSNSNKKEEPWKSISGLSDSNWFFKFDAALMKPNLIDVTGMSS